jgi:lysophospholipase L1-like esterase
MKLQTKIFKALRNTAKTLTLTSFTLTCFYAMAADMQIQPEATVKIPDKKADFHIYLLMGQSNMAGRGRLPDVPRTENSQILMLTPSNTWTYARDPLHKQIGRIRPGVGPGISFAETRLKYLPEGTVIGLIPCAVGGSPLKRWTRNGDLYKAALKSAKEVSRAGTIKGVLWHQGETDAGRGSAHSYGPNLKKIISDVRNDLNAPELPFVLGHIGSFLRPDKFLHADVINNAITDIAENDPYVELVETADLKDGGDRLHFDTASAKILGKRYAKAMKKLAGIMAETENMQTQIKIAIIGDSTVCNYAQNHPNRGWGMYIEEAFEEGTVKVHNYAQSGRSTKTFISRGLWKRTLAVDPDIVLIQFGHNDSHTPGKPEATDAETDFRDNLNRYIDESLAINAKPVLVTPMVRRNFNPDGTLNDTLSPYADAMKAVAAKRKIAIIDLHTSSWKLIEPMGPNKAKRMDSKRNDTTHFNEMGARAMAKLVLNELPDAVPELKRIVKKRTNAK